MTTPFNPTCSNAGAKCACKNCNPKAVEITGILENWKWDTTYQRSLTGHIYGDTKGRFFDGKYIFTSTVLSHDRNVDLALKEGDIVHTMNSSYKLGKPHVSVLARSS